MTHSSARILSSALQATSSATNISPTPVNATGTASVDTIHGSDFADTISGGSSGGDFLYGYGGDDMIDGGDEPVANGASGDSLHGGAGNDLLHGKGGADSLHGDDGEDKLYGEANEDYLDGGAGNDVLDGGDGDDVLRDDQGQNILLGGAGKDYLFSGSGGMQDGGDGDDLLGGFGSTHYVGGAGKDTISLYLFDRQTSTAEGGADDDRFDFDIERQADVRIDVTGGGGIDTYAIGLARMSADTRVQVRIADFAVGAGGDRIDLLELLGAGYGSNPFHDGFLRLVADGADTRLEVRAGDASGSYHGLFTLAGVSASSLTRENFVGGIDPAGASGGLILNGTASSDLLTGTPFADTLNGSDGDDRLTGNGGDDSLGGGSGQDTLDGDAGRDVLSGGAGNDSLNGGAGADRVIFTGVRADYSFTRTEHGYSVTDKRGAAGDGIDSLTDVERATFADSHVALDVDGAAGDVFRLYRAAFKREPDAGGQGFWMEMLDRGASLEDVAKGFIASKEFSDLYGVAPTEGEFVTRLYQNVLDREPDPGGYGYWLQVLGLTKANFATILVGFSNSAENVDKVAELIADGITYTPFG